jgi:hypothetical protein
MKRKEKMFKKITLIGLFVIFFAILLVGGVNRTLARTNSGGEGQSRGRQGASSDYGERFDAVGDDDRDREGNSNGWGRGRQQDEGDLSSSSGAYVQNNSEDGGYRRGNRGVPDSLEIMPAGTGELDQIEKEALLYMREEEKLANDVYLAMYDLWGMQIFQNISSSERSHTEAIKTLLDGYGLPDPAQDGVGVFTNPDLQALYQELVAKGGQSLADALRVGAVIEEIDILDLQESLAQTDNTDIQRVFNNLLEASSNHLRAFTSTLSNQTGETYQAQYLSQEAYQDIIASSPQGFSQGRSGGVGRGRGGRP